MKLSIWTWKYLFPLQEKKKKAHEKKNQQQPWNSWKTVSIYPPMISYKHVMTFRAHVAFLEKEGDMTHE